MLTIVEALQLYLIVLIQPIQSLQMDSVMLHALQLIRLTSGRQPVTRCVHGDTLILVEQPVLELLANMTEGSEKFHPAVAQVTQAMMQHLDVINPQDTLFGTLYVDKVILLELQLIFLTKHARIGLKIVVYRHQLWQKLLT